MSSAIKGDFLVIDMGLDLLEKRRQVVDKNWEEHCSWVFDSIHQICEESNAPWMGDGSRQVLLKTPGAKSKKKRFTAAQSAVLSMSQKVAKTTYRSCRRQLEEDTLVEPTVFESASENEAVDSDEKFPEKAKTVAGKDTFVRLEPMIKSPGGLHIKTTSGTWSRNSPKGSFQAEADTKGPVAEEAPKTRSSQRMGKKSVNLINLEDSVAPVVEMPDDSISVIPLIPREENQSESEMEVSPVKSGTQSERESHEESEETEKETERRKTRTSRFGSNKSKSRGGQGLPISVGSDQEEWMTDDEDHDEKGQESNERFFDAMSSVVKQNALKRDLNSKCPLVAGNKDGKTVLQPKRQKASQYFTPQALVPRSTRATTRALARVVPKLNHNNSKLSTPQSVANTASKGSASKSISRVARKVADVVTSSGGSGTSGGSTMRSNRCVSRLKAPGSDNKHLTESAAKRRRDAEEHRLAHLTQKLQEKEERGLQHKEVQLQQKVMEHKMKREDKEKKAAELREQLSKENEEKQQKELQKKEDTERRRKEKEEARREEHRKRQEILIAKQAEAEQRKVQEEKERLAKIQKQEEATRKKLEEAERNRLEQERTAALIQQHNSSLQQKAAGNSFLKKTQSAAKLIPEGAAAAIATGGKPDGEPVQPMNSTFTLPKLEAVASSNIIQSYSITPPPKAVRKPPNLDNYDISDIKSEDDSDDDRNPHKPVPVWAKGQQFLKALGEQYGKPSRNRERDCMTVFGQVAFPVELGVIFAGEKVKVSAKYAKRTSSAVWLSPPGKHLNNHSFNSTFSRSKSETSICEYN